jgi:hypothetical protein
VVRLIQGQLLAHALLAFAQGHDATPDGGQVLVDRQVDALNERGVDVPPLWGQHVLDTSLRAEHYAMAHLNQLSASVFLDDLRIEQPCQGHPARLRGRACGLSERELNPGHKVGQ